MDETGKAQIAAQALKALVAEDVEDGEPLGRRGPRRCWSAGAPGHPRRWPAFRRTRRPGTEDERHPGDGGDWARFLQSVGLTPAAWMATRISLIPAPV